MKVRLRISVTPFGFWWLDCPCCLLTSSYQQICWCGCRPSPVWTRLFLPSVVYGCSVYSSGGEEECHIRLAHIRYLWLGICSKYHKRMSGLFMRPGPRSTVSVQDKLPKSIINLLVIFQVLSPILPCWARLWSCWIRWMLFRIWCLRDRESILTDHLWPWRNCEAVLYISKAHPKHDI